MRYIEYIYLGAAACLVIFMVTQHKQFTTVNYVAVVVAILVATFMYSFRRNQRIAAERQEAEEIRRLEEEIKDDDNG